MRSLPVALALVLLTLPSTAAMIVGTHPDTSGSSGSLSDLRLDVDLVVQDGKATFTFRNVSDGEETSAVFKELLLDTIDSDTGTVILWDGEVIDASPGVSFSIKTSNGLPGYQQQTKDSGALEFQASPSPVKKGLAVGTMLEVQFSTSLPDGSNLSDYYGAFGAGQDMMAYSIGFHALNAKHGVSGVNAPVAIPEPVTMSLLALGGIALVRRRRQHA